MIFIVDNFLENPSEIRNKLLNLKPDLIVSDVIPGYRHYNLITKKDDFGIGEKIQNLINEIIDPNLKINHSGFHFITKDFCEGGSHYDSEHCKYAAVLYLTPNPPKNSGTKIYKDKINYKFYNHKKYLTEIKRFLKEDKNILSKIKYSLLMKKYNFQFGEGVAIDNQFNRLIIYPSSYVHKAMNFFGNKMSNCRLTHFSFFS